MLDLSTLRGREPEEPKAATITPLGDRVVIQIDAAPRQVNGIHIPDGRRVDNAAAQFATVVDVGPLVVSLLPRDRVLVPAKFDGESLTYAGATFHVLRERFVLARVTMGEEIYDLDAIDAAIKRLCRRHAEITGGEE